MNKLKYCLALVMFVFLCVSASSQSYKNIRMAHLPIGYRDSVSTDFYRRARSNGFNYVLLYIQSLSNEGWSNGEYNGTDLKKWLSELFIGADRHGLKVIPGIPTGNKYSHVWDATDNSNIDWQKLPSGGPNDSSKTTPAFAPDSAGFEHSFKGFLRVVYEAFEMARADTAHPLSYSNLDYIHFGADEPKLPYDGKYVMLAGLCRTDTAWLRSNGLDTLSTQARIIALLGISFRRKTEMIRDVGKEWSQTTKAMYYADMLDPSSIGGHSRLVAFSSYANPQWYQYDSINTSGLVNDPNVLAVRDVSVPILWYYTEEVYDEENKKYNTFESFNHLASRGFNFMYGSALDEINTGRVKHLMKQAGIAGDPAFSGRLVGAGAFHWVEGGYDASKHQFKVMEYLSQTLWHNAAVFD